MLVGSWDCCFAINVIAILPVGSWHSGYKTYPQSHSLEGAKPGLQSEHLPRGSVLRFPGLPQ